MTHTTHIKHTFNLLNNNNTQSAHLHNKKMNSTESFFVSAPCLLLPGTKRQKDLQCFSTQKFDRAKSN